MNLTSMQNCIVIIAHFTQIDQHSSFLSGRLNSNDGFMCFPGSPCIYVHGLTS